MNQNTRSPSLSENLNLEKEWPFLFLGSLGTVPLHFRDIMDISNEVLIRY